MKIGTRLTLLLVSILVLLGGAITYAVSQMSEIEAELVEIKAQHEELMAQTQTTDAGDLLALLKQKEATLASAVNAVLDHQSQARQVLIWLTLVAVVVAILFGLLIIRSITRPLHFVTHSAQQVAEGRLSLEWNHLDRQDELGDLVRSFRQLVDYLDHAATMATAVGNGDLTVSVSAKSSDDRLGMALSEMVRNLQEAITEIQSTVGELASTTAQITSTTSQFASSSSETASAIAETTATVAEVRQTADLVNEKASLVSRNAQQVERVSNEGLQAVDGTSTAMARIEEQMRTIAERIVALSEQSQAIADIVDSVEDLAEQSNLLAVNASIEAAKAGEHGKGFAVVAQEIRNLANESKRSTHQIRSILNDIQQATGKAVMVTEQGSKVVESGVDQSRQASEAVAGMSSAIEEAAISASQIAASSQEQLVGMGQVTNAMDDIKEASSQNAEGSRMLESAGQGLRQLGNRLQELVARYRVGS